MIKFTQIKNEVLYLETYEIEVIVLFYDFS